MHKLRRACADHQRAVRTQRKQESKGHVLNCLLHSPGLGQTGEKEDGTDVVSWAVCQYLVVTQDTNGICDAHTAKARHGGQKKLVQWTDLTWQPENTVPPVSEI